jgi:hypothetical protein
MKSTKKERREHLLEANMKEQIIVELPLSQAK